MKPTRKFAGYALLVVGGVFLAETLFQVIFHLAVGWYGFLQRVVPEIRWTLSGWSIGIVALAVCIAGGHILIQSLISNRARPVGPEADLASAGTSSPAASQAAGPDSHLKEHPRTTDHISWKFRQTLVVVGLIVVLCMTSIAATASAHATIWFVFSDSPMLESSEWRTFISMSAGKNHLKQIGIALHTYNDRHRTLPTGGTFLKDGAQGHSWMTQILPHIDHVWLHESVRKSESWMSPGNSKVFRQPVPLYCYPSGDVEFTRDGYPASDFAANQFVMGLNRSMQLEKIPDGMSQTMLVGQVKDQRRAWGDPRNHRDPYLGINRSPDGFGGHFRGSALILFADGSVRTIGEQIDPQILGAMGTPNGGETISDQEWSKW